MNDIQKSIYEYSKKTKAWAPCVAGEHTSCHHHWKPRQNYAAAVTTGTKPFNNDINMSDRKLNNEGKCKETVQHWSVQHQLYANRSKLSYCEVTKENKAQGRAITEGSWFWLWKSTSQKTELITLATSTNGWNQKQIKWGKHEPHKRLCHPSIQKRGETVHWCRLTVVHPFRKAISATVPRFYLSWQ